MRPDAVVEKPEFSERMIQGFETHHLPLIEFPLQRPEQPLDPSVLPRTAGIGALVLNPRQRQHNAKHPAGETRFIVRAQRTRLAVFADGNEQVCEQRPRAFVGQCRQCEQAPAAVIEQPQDPVQPVFRIRLARQIHRPNSIAR